MVQMNDDRLKRNTFEEAKEHDRTRIDPTDILLTDMVAVVTGGGGGIGKGIALGLAKFGADVVIIDNEPSRAEHTATLITEMGRRSLALPVNVMDSTPLKEAIEIAASTFGRLDILVNNAGGVRAGAFLDQNERSWRRHIDINLMSMLTATHTAAPVMIAGGRGGSIVNVSSIEGSRAAPDYAVYSACKAGMENFTRTMSLELAPHHIRMNAIAPDHTVTGGNRGNRTGPVDPSQWIELTGEQQAARDDMIPMGREGLVDECASVVVFLCSNMASYVTGVTVPVDGGTKASSGWLRTPDGSWTQTR
jgi:NAD(P)-dependent dehydrogenase (short-subunit alcohol dehydrogenase family)